MLIGILWTTNELIHFKLEDIIHRLLSEKFQSFHKTMYILRYKQNMRE